jgi:hypothetical protein
LLQRLCKQLDCPIEPPILDRDDTQHVQRIEMPRLQTQNVLIAALSVFEQPFRLAS